MLDSKTRPAFIDAVSGAYLDRRKSVILLTGNTLDVFWREGSQAFLPLEQIVYQELHEKFLVLRVDSATGIGFYNDADRVELTRLCALADTTANDDQKIGSLARLLAKTRESSLATLVLLRGLTEALERVRRGEPSAKPLVVIFQFAGSILPPGDYDRLAELDRQRLITFLSWVSDPLFAQSPNLLLLVSGTRSEINSRIHSLPVTHHVEIELPDLDARARFVDRYAAKQNGSLKFEPNREAILVDMAALRLTSIEDLLEQAVGLNEPLKRSRVLEMVNAILEAELGEIVKVLVPDHGVADLIGNDRSNDIITRIFKRCDDPSTAVSAILISGPNGGGKTFTLEAFAADSGRIVVSLSGLRGKGFGDTEKFFEMFLWHIRTYGRIIILVDEAHTAFGSVHKEDTHETEKRLAGNVIKMMSDRRLFGKVLWALMTSRPDELDPDIKSRAPLQVPIFDLEGEPRKQFVAELFRRNKLIIDDGQLETVMEATKLYSSRDYDALVRECRADGRSVIEVLGEWQASSAIVPQRRMQTLIAAQHCTYPALLPEEIRKMSAEEIDAEVKLLKLQLYR